MTGPNDKRFEELLTADEGPMRRELMRQIAALELKLSKFRRDHAPFEQLPELLQRGPALLSTEQLEQVRDEMLGLIDDLQGRVTRRFADRIEDVPADPYAVEPAAPRSWFQRLVQRVRRAFRDPRAQ